MDRINKKSMLQIALALGGLFITTMIIYIVITIKDIKNISNKIDAQRAELEIKYQSGLLLRSNIQELVKIKPIIQSMELSLINSDDTLSFINDLENEAEKLGIEQIINIPEIQIEIDKITTSAIQLTLKGRADQILHYINILDAKPYYINIADIQMTNENQADSSSKNINAVINGTIYWR